MRGGYSLEEHPATQAQLTTMNLLVRKLKFIIDTAVQSKSYCHTVNVALLR